MKKIKIYAFPSHDTKERTSGVDFARIIQPMEHLNGYKSGEYEFETKVYRSKDDEGLVTWNEITDYYDCIYFNYTPNPWAFAAMGAMARMKGKKLILDMDDTLWNVMPDNPAYNAWKKGGEHIKNFTAICNEVDHITCTNRYLKNVITHNTLKRGDQITAFPNRIDFKLYNHRCGFKDTLEINLLHFGSTTHFIDLQNKEFEKGIDMIMRDYPNVKLLTAGAMIPEYRRKWGQRYVNSYGDQDLYKWVKERFPYFMDQADICVVPLEDTLYNRCKSSIKFLEMSSAVKPGVYQNIRQYQELVKHGENGFLAGTAQEWYDAIKKLIDDKELRRTMGQNAFKTVEEGWQMKDNLEEYAQFFIKQLA